MNSFRREVRFVDTSVLCDLLRVPGKCQRSEEVRAELDALVNAGVQLVLPVATIIETGNHIVQAGDGGARRKCAERFVRLLKLTAGRGAPWVLHSVAWDERMLHLLCDGVPATGPFLELAAAGSLGSGDLSILAERELYAERTAGVRVRIWTHDTTLAAYGP